MKAEPGDELIVESAEAGRPVRVGTIIALGSTNGTPGSLVHWVAGDCGSLVVPWPGIRATHAAAVTAHEEVEGVPTPPASPAS